MSDSDAIFEATARTAEAEAQANPAGYKRRLLLFALLGYVVIFAILAALFGILGGLVGLAFVSTSALLVLLLKKKLIFLILPAIWVLLKALWVRFTPPEGYELTRRQVPLLFNELNALQQQLKTPKIDRVLLTPEFNASIAQTPRLGIFGWHQTTLSLGLELLLVLPPQEARAAIAHELGHLSGNHSRFNGWIYRSRISWSNVMEAFHESDSWGARLMRKFFDWYAPRFAAYSFALARANEYEADAISAELTSRETAGRMLVNVHVTSPYVDSHYWDHFFKQADGIPRPPHGPWSGLHAFLGEHEQARAKLADMLADELAVKTTYHNTHPALADRIAALKLAPAEPGTGRETAARTWFGDAYDAIIGDFDREWIEHFSERWQQRFNYVHESREELAGLRARDEVELSDDELWRFARLVEEFENDEAALALYRTYQARHPDDADAGFVIGRILYGMDDAGVLDEMKKALAEPGHVLDACEYAYHFLTRHGRGDEAEWWREQAEKQAQIDAEFREERSRLMPDDELQLAKIDAETRQRLIDALTSHPKVKQAWLAEKVLRHYQERSPALTVAIKLGGLLTDADEVENELLAELDIPATLFIVARSGEYKKLANRIIKAGERIL